MSISCASGKDCRYHSSRQSGPFAAAPEALISVKWSGVLHPNQSAFWVRIGLPQDLDGDLVSFLQPWRQDLKRAVCYFCMYAEVKQARENGAKGNFVYITYDHALRLVQDAENVVQRQAEAEEKRRKQEAAALAAEQRRLGITTDAFANALKEALQAA